MLGFEDAVVDRNLSNELEGDLRSTFEKIQASSHTSVRHHRRAEDTLRFTTTPAIG
jgi:hypothetical protein